MRIQLDFPPKAVRRLKVLKIRTEAASYAEVFKNALRVYEAMIDEAEAGREFLTRDKDGETTAFKPFL